MERVTIPDVIHGIVDQSDGRFVLEDFVPVPCCFPTCQAGEYCPNCWTQYLSVSYEGPMCSSCASAWVEENTEY